MSRTDAYDRMKMDGDVRSPDTDGARPSAAGDGHAREASASCSVSACHMDRLPAELLQQVLSHLWLSQQLDVQLVSRRWRDAVLALLRRRQQLDMCAERMPCGWSDRTLCRVLRLMPSLCVLRLGDTRSYSTLGIVATHCKRLVEIQLYGFGINKDKPSLKRLCLACQSLEKVTLLLNVSESSVRVLLQHLPALRTLELNHNERITGQCFSLLPASLRRLSLAYCGGLHSDALLHVGTRCPQLRELDVSGVTHLEPSHVSAALSGCPLLERLRALFLREPLEQHLPAAGLPGLRHLNVDSASGVTDSTLRLLPDLLPALHTLNIMGCRDVTEEGLLHVYRWKELLSLNLSWLRGVTDAVLDRLHELPLRKICLAGRYPEMGTYTWQGVVRLVLACQSLTLLDVSEVRRLLIPAMVDELAELLPPSRRITLYWGGTRRCSLLPPPDPLRL